jgi:uncharacterized protein (TIGR02145 family)
MKKNITLLIYVLFFKFSNSAIVEINLKVFLEGPFQTNVMIPILNVEEAIPLIQPYNSSPWYYDGNESVDSIPSDEIIDWVLVDIIKPLGALETLQFELIARKAGFLSSDGLVTDINGTSLLAINVYDSSVMYVSIHHRNHLSIVSSQPLVKQNGIYTYDFTYDAEQSLGSIYSVKEIAPNTWGMICSDATSDGQIDNNDKNDVWLIEFETVGYLKGDFNMDHIVNNIDLVNKWKINSGKGFPISIRHPSVDIICGDSIIDIRDGKKYVTVQIGDQCWMGQNLNFGIMIYGNQSNNGIPEKFCYNNNNNNCEIYGGLYQWDEMMEYLNQEGGKGICPTGWHCPTDNELCTVTVFIDATTNCNITGLSGINVGFKMKSTSGWYSGGNGSDQFGFKVLPGGYRFVTAFIGLGQNAYFWSSTEANSGNAWKRGFFYNNSNIQRNSYGKFHGYSVRCLKNN